jgi:hypothetical protein
VCWPNCETTSPDPCASGYIDRLGWARAGCEESPVFQCSSGLDLNPRPPGYEPALVSRSTAASIPRRTSVDSMSRTARVEFIDEAEMGRCATVYALFARELSD